MNRTELVVYFLRRALALTFTDSTDVGSASTRLPIVLAAARHEEAATEAAAAAAVTVEAMVVNKAAEVRTIPSACCFTANFGIRLRRWSR